MTPAFTTLDPPTTELIRLAALIAGGEEQEQREGFARAVGIVPSQWVDELIVQSYLFCGFPRALNAAREWRQISPEVVRPTDECEDDTLAGLWRARGEVTCRAVYGPMYEKLRSNVRELHPALDAAMLVEGYGKILGRSGLDLPRRELCIVAACAVTGQDRQLQSHLHGALNVGISAAVLSEATEALAPILGEKRAHSVRLLLASVIGK